MTREANRRDVIKYAAILAAGVGTATASSASGEPSGQQSSPPTGASEAGNPADALLARAKQGPEGFMLSEPVIVTLDSDRHRRTLWINPAYDENGRRVQVSVPTRSVRIFRADPTVDEVTRQGGVYWRFRDTAGTLELKASGADSLHPVAGGGPIVMLVRDMETVRIYTMTLDFRC
jgi:hypothetical protein